MSLQFCLTTLGDNPPDPLTGHVCSDAEKHLSMIAKAKAAEAAGFHVFQLGEHHFNYYQISAPFVALAALSQHTSQIRLATGVSLMPTIDPIILAEDAVTLDIYSNGRAEIGAGRGVHEQIFTAMGRSAADATDLMAENIEILHHLLSDEALTYNCQHRPPIKGITIRPHPIQRPIPIWVGSSSCIDQAARLGLPCIWGSVLNPHAALIPMAEKYREAWAAAGRALADLQLGIGVHAHVATTTQKAKERFQPYYADYFNRSKGIEKSAIKRSNSFAPVSSMIDDVVLCGSPQDLVDKIGKAKDALGLTRISLSIDMAGQPDDMVLEQIELLGSEVIPAFN